MGFPQVLYISGIPPVQVCVSGVPSGVCDSRMAYSPPSLLGTKRKYF